MTTHNAADPQQIREAREADELKARQLREDLAFLLSTPQGLRWFRRFVADAYIFHTTFTGNSWGGFNEGARGLGLKVWAQIVEAAPERILDLILVTEGQQND